MQPTGQYVIYGVIPEEHEETNSDTPEDQRVAGTAPIYSTDDKAEARKIMQEGGFIDEGNNWKVAIWAKDTVGGGTMGAVPTGA